VSSHARKKATRFPRPVEEGRSLPLRDHWGKERGPKFPLIPHRRKEKKHINICEVRGKKAGLQRRRAKRSFSYKKGGKERKGGPKKGHCKGSETTILHLEGNGHRTAAACKKLGKRQESFLRKEDRPDIAGITKDSTRGRKPYEFPVKEK